jgi:hypothetical protein
MILGHPKNPLLLHGDDPDELLYHTTYLIYRLLSLAKTSQSNITTLDGVLGLYRGSNDIIDTVLFKIISHIESQQARSCASRISDWSILENSAGKALIMRVRGRLFVSIDAKTLARSIFQSPPTKPDISEEELNDLESFMAIAKHQERVFSQTYDLEFMLPVLTYCLLSENIIIDVQTAIEKYSLGFAIKGLCSDRGNVQRMAVGYITTVIAKLEVSNIFYLRLLF